MKIAWKVIKGHGPYAYLQETVRTKRGTTVSKHVAYLGKAAKFPPGLAVTIQGESVQVPKIPQDIYEALVSKDRQKLEASMLTTGSDAMPSGGVDDVINLKKLEPLYEKLDELTDKVAEADPRFQDEHDGDYSTFLEAVHPQLYEAFIEIDSALRRLGEDPTADVSYADIASAEKILADYESAGPTETSTEERYDSVSPTVERDSDLWNQAVAEAVRLEKIADELVEAAGVDNDDWGEWMDDNHPELRDALTNIEIVVYGPPTDDPSVTEGEAKLLIDHAKQFQSEDREQPREVEAAPKPTGAAGGGEVIEKDSNLWKKAEAEAERLGKIADDLYDNSGIEDDQGEWMDDNVPELRDAVTNLEMVVYGPPDDVPTATVDQVGEMLEEGYLFESDYMKDALFIPADRRGDRASPAPKDDKETISRDSNLWKQAEEEAERLGKIADDLYDNSGVEDDQGEWMDDEIPELRDAVTNLEMVVYGPPDDDPTATVEEVRGMLEAGGVFKSDRTGKEGEGISQALVDRIDAADTIVTTLGMEVESAHEEEFGSEELEGPFEDYGSAGGEIMDLHQRLSKGETIPASEQAEIIEIMDQFDTGWAAVVKQWPLMAEPGRKPELREFGHATIDKGSLLWREAQAEFKRLDKAADRLVEAATGNPNPPNWQRLEYMDENQRELRSLIIEAGKVVHGPAENTTEEAARQFIKDAYKFPGAWVAAEIEAIKKSESQGSDAMPSGGTDDGYDPLPAGFMTDAEKATEEAKEAALLKTLEETPDTGPSDEQLYAEQRAEIQAEDAWLREAEKPDPETGSPGDLKERELEGQLARDMLGATSADLKKTYFSDVSDLHEQLAQARDMRGGDEYDTTGGSGMMSDPVARAHDRLANQKMLLDFGLEQGYGTTDSAQIQEALRVGKQALASPFGSVKDVPGPTDRVNVSTTDMPTARVWADRMYARAGERSLEADLPKFDYHYTALKEATSEALDVPRGEMPVIEPEDIIQFNTDLQSGRIDIFPPYAKGQLFTPKELPTKEAKEEWIDLGFRDGETKDDIAGGVITRMKAEDMKPTQSEIFLNKLIGAALQFGPAKQDTPVTEATIIVSSDGFILDGHHRYGQAMLSNPQLEMKVLKLPVPIETLLKVGRSYTDYLGRSVKSGTE